MSVVSFCKTFDIVCYTSFKSVNQIRIDELMSLENQMKNVLSPPQCTKKKDKKKKNAKY